MLLAHFITLCLVIPMQGRLVVPGLSPSRYEVPGDLTLGVLVHTSLVGDLTNSEYCAPGLPRMIAIHLCEAAVFAAKQINEQNVLLPNLTLGVTCLNSCDDPLVSLARSLSLVEQYEDDGQDHPKVVGVVGPIHSEDAIFVSSFLGLFHIPVLGTHSTSDELTVNNVHYQYFMGLAPPDRFQAQALIDLVRYFNWTYIGLFYSEGSYGEFGARQVESLAMEHGLCLAFSYKISMNYMAGEKEEVLELFARHPNLKSIIWFTEGQGVRTVFGAVAQKFPKPNAIHLLSYLSGYLRVRYPRATEGSFGVRQFTSSVPGFRDYITGLIPGKNTENTWLKTLWQDHFKCRWLSGTNNSCEDYSADERWYGHYPIYPSYYEGVLVYAHALRKVIQTKCLDGLGNTTHIQNCIKGSDVLAAMKNSSTPTAYGSITFNEQGERLGKYNIIQQVRTSDDKFKTNAIGIWDKLTNSLSINEEAMDMDFLKDPLNDPRKGQSKMLASGKSLYVPHSVCSWPCAPGEFMLHHSSLSCCWECMSCRDNEVVENDTHCVACPLFTWPYHQEHHQECAHIPPTYLQWSDSISLSLALLSALGIAITCTTIVIFWRCRSRKLVKASNKVLSIVILIGTFLAYGCTLMIISTPSTVTCLLRRIGFNMSVCLLYAPVFVKTLAVCRIFRSGKKGLKRPQFVSSLAQSVSVAVVVAGQVGLLVLVELLYPSQTELLMPVTTERYVELTCTNPLVPFLLPLSYNVIFILVCAVLGYTSRKLPENFNESGFIFISVATTLFAWMVFLPTYFTAAKAHHQAAILGLCLLLNAYITVGCLFGPKIYALFFVDEVTMKFNTALNKTMPSVGPSDNSQSLASTSKY